MNWPGIAVTVCIVLAVLFVLAVVGAIHIGHA